MANTQINITENGTTTLATAGKYCDRNIDVNVDTRKKYTNLYDPANVTLKTLHKCSSSTGLTFSTDNYVNYVKIPYHHKAGEPVAIRVRGISTPVRDRQDFTLLLADESVTTWGQFASSITMSYDECGDMVCSFKDGSTFVGREWYYLLLNFQYIGVNSSASQAFEGPIITINEPIG